MNSNKTAVDHLTEFVNSSRAEEHYHALCEGCGTSIPTAESRQQVADAKALAARLIVELSDPDAREDTWATAVRDTIFDRHDAARVRGDLIEPDKQMVITKLLAQILTGSSHSDTPSYCGWASSRDYKDGWGSTSYEVRVEYIKERAIRGSRVNPHGDVRIPAHHALCPNEPEPVEQ
jgi:hypothetical protein